MSRALESMKRARRTGKAKRTRQVEGEQLKRQRVHLTGTSRCSFAYMDVGEGREQDAEALPVLRLLVVFIGFYISLTACLEQ